MKVKYNKNIVKNSPDINKKPYEQCKAEIIMLESEVMLASTPYNTQGTYESKSSWTVVWR